MWKVKASFINGQQASKIEVLLPAYDEADAYSQFKQWVKANLKVLDVSNMQGQPEIIKVF